VKQTTMTRFSFSSLRVRLLFLVLLALVPAFGLILYTAWEQRQSAAGDAKEKTLNFARDAVEQQRQLIADTRNVLIALTRDPLTMSSQRGACARFLTGQLKKHAPFSNLGVIDLDGNLKCSARPYEGAINLRDRIYFQKTIETQDLSVSDYQIGRVTGKATVTFGYPLFDNGGKLRAVVFASLDLEWLNRLVAQSRFSPGSALFVVDRQGTILAHSFESEKWVGKSLPQVPIVSIILKEQREGTVEAAGVDGVSRLYAFTSLPVSRDNRTYVAIGIPTRLAYADANHILFRNLLFLCLVSVLALVGAWFGGDLFILRQVNALVDATQRLAFGDLGARAGLIYPSGELGQLAESFNAMGDALQTREAELRCSKEETQRHWERIRALYEINLAINSTLDLQSIADVLLEKANCFFSYPTAATLRLVKKTSGELEPFACRNMDESVWKAEQGRFGRGLTNEVAETRAHLAVEEIDADPRTEEAEFFRQNKLVSYLGVPLVAKGEILGVLSIYSKVRHRFTHEEIEFLGTLGEQAAIAIDNSEIYEETRNRAVESDTANKLKGEFLSVMSHELRTPLAVAMGYTGMIKEGVLGGINSQQQQALEKVLRRGHDQLYMINSILYAASLEAKAVKVERNNVNPSDMLDELRSSYDVILEKKITLAWDYSSDLPSIRTDARKLRHVLENLINNAIKFTDKGSVSISARCLPSAKIVKFAVTDTGIGISKDFLPIVFDIFRQVDGSSTRLHGGVGLGLYIVKKFTELLDGKVEVESHFGKGSTFTVAIPYGTIEESAADFQSQHSASQAA
jgi:signal transduction histidine kinase/HAMP domain-containing protein